MTQIWAFPSTPLALEKTIRPVGAEAAEAIDAQSAARPSSGSSRSTRASCLLVVSPK
jgi:hypothetical protein